MYGRKPQGWVKHIDFMLIDVLCLHAAFLLAYISRHGLTSPYANSFYISIAIVYTVVDILVMILNSTMKNVLKRGYYKEFAQTVKHVFLVALIVTCYLFSTQEGVEYSRIVFYLQAIYYLLLSYSARILWKKMLRRKKVDARSAAIYFVTTYDRAEDVITHFRANNLGEYSAQGLCVLDRDCVGQVISGVAVDATIDTVLEYLCDKWIDEVYISVPQEFTYPEKLISGIADMGIVVHVELEQAKTSQWQHQAIEEVAGSTVRTFSMTMATPGQRFMKRVIDIAGGIVGCLLTAVLTLILGPVIYIKSPGPIFFAQTRVGKNGKKFKLYKFRSMYPDAEERKAALMKENRIKDGMMFKLDFDPRIIGAKKLPDGTVKKGIGNFIRDWSLDEFPQFYNVLKGDLSLCGTRPPTVDEWEKYELHHRARLAIKPGITGLWQVSGRSNITDFEQVVELDKEYIRKWSMGLDFRILLQTVKAVLGRDGSM
ncbi:MAG: sugar transferase [Ruminococcaceae bacterium]|nr:sugar transferase [Oscillospiraceae bacterium]